MRVAIIAPPWFPIPPTAYGGTELVLDVLCRGLVAAGEDVLLLATGDSTCPVPRLSTFDTSIGFADATPAAELHHVVESYDAAIAWRADIVHDHTVTGVAWAFRFPNLPVVTTNHGPFEGDLVAIYRRTAASVPVIAISHHQASTARGIPVATVIHHGVDVDQYALGEGRGGYAVFLGRMSREKGVHRAIEVARKAGIPLRIAAKMHEGPERAYFADVVQPLLGGDVEYVGEADTAAKHELLADATLLLNPITWAEPFGMVMVEALAHGTPVLGSPYGAAPEIVDEGVTGFLRSDVDELARLVVRAADLDRAACRAAAESRFSMQRMAIDHIAFYASHLAVVGHDTLATRGELRL